MRECNYCCSVANVAHAHVRFCVCVLVHDNAANAVQSERVRLSVSVRHAGVMAMFMRVIIRVLTENIHTHTQTASKSSFHAHPQNRSKSSMCHDNRIACVCVRQFRISPVGSHYSSIIKSTRRGHLLPSRRNILGNNYNRTCVCERRVGGMSIIRMASDTLFTFALLLLKVTRSPRRSPSCLAASLMCRRRRRRRRRPLRIEQSACLCADNYRLHNAQRVLCGDHPSWAPSLSLAAIISSEK